jgi:hypothetical protein
MTSRPILFSAPMVRALLCGSKTQTRRICKLARAGMPEPEMASLLKCCPYGRPGDELWVREAFCDDWKESRGIVYRADGGFDADMFDAGCRWRPSIHMPRAASRITLRITDVRVERLQDISAKDILAEGAVDRPHVDQFGRNPVSAFDGKVYMDLRSLWACGWESINGKGSWAANPWLWVLSFERVK